MSVIRNETRTRFTIINRDTLRDPQLSWAAKGLLATMLSFPDDWDYNIAHLLKHATNGRDATSSAMKELIAAGYVERTRQRNEDGTMGDAVYLVRETSYGKPNVGESPTTKYVTPTKNEEKHRLSAKKKGSAPVSPSAPLPPPANVTAETWDAFIEHRKQIKKKLTPVAVRRLKQKLESKPRDIAEAMLWKTIENGWTGVFDLTPREVNDVLADARPSSTDPASRLQRMEAERKRQQEETLKLSEMPYDPQ